MERRPRGARPVRSVDPGEDPEMFTFIGVLVELLASRIAANHNQSRLAA
jgi:hypothetical protein